MTKLLGMSNFCEKKSPINHFHGSDMPHKDLHLTDNPILNDNTFCFDPHKDVEFFFLKIGRLFFLITSWSEADLGLLQHPI